MCVKGGKAPPAVGPKRRVNKDARALFEQAHIPGAQFFDIDAVSTPSDLPHTAPTPEIFAAAVG